MASNSIFDSFANYSSSLLRGRAHLLPWQFQSDGVGSEQ
uniref:Uncharacterized protein n=1 Tax=Neogobius melanostomus TaxID=47308 RepID=A0A8C6U050_9GOBI